MPMKRTTPAANPDAYVAALTGWRRACVEELRAAVRSVPGLTETIKWGHLVYLAKGPVLLIGARRRGGERDHTTRVGNSRTPRIPVRLEVRHERAILRKNVVPLRRVVPGAGRCGGKDHEHERSRAVH